jgi:tetratricopeptide (TPR) repeat protein
LHAAAGLAAVGVASGALAVRYVDYAAWRAFYHCQVGEMYWQLGEEKTAGSYLRRAVDDKMSADSLKSLGHYTYEVENDPIAARQLFRQCIESDPTYPDPHYFLAGIDLAQGYPAAALAELRQYIHLRDAHRMPEGTDPFTLLRALYYAVPLEAQAGYEDLSALYRRRATILANALRSTPADARGADLLERVEALLDRTLER